MLTLTHGGARDVLYHPGSLDAFSSPQLSSGCYSHLLSLPSHDDATPFPSSSSPVESPLLAAPWEDEENGFSLSSSPSSWEEGSPSSPNGYQVPPYLHSTSSSIEASSPGSPIGILLASSFTDAYEEDDFAAYLSSPAADTSSPSPPAWTPAAAGKSPHAGQLWPPPDYQGGQLISGSRHTQERTTPLFCHPIPPTSLSAAPPYVAPVWHREADGQFRGVDPVIESPTPSSVSTSSWCTTSPAAVPAIAVWVYRLLRGTLSFPRVAWLLGSFPDRSTCQSHLSSRRHRDHEASAALKRAESTLSHRRCNKRRSGVEYLELEKRLSHYVQTLLIKPHLERLKIPTVYADFVAVKHNLRLDQINSWNTLIQLYFLFLYDPSSDAQRLRVPNGGLLDSFFLVVIYRCCEYLRLQPTAFSSPKPGVVIGTPRDPKALPSNEDLRRALDEAKGLLPSGDCTLEQCVNMDFTRLFYELRVESGALPPVPGADGQTTKLIYNRQGSDLSCIDLEDADDWYDPEEEDSYQYYNEDPVRCERVVPRIVEELEHPLPGEGGRPVALFHLEPEFDCQQQPSTPASTLAYVVGQQSGAAPYPAADVSERQPLAAIAHRQDDGWTPPFKRARVDVPTAFVDYPSAQSESLRSLQRCPTNSMSRTRW